MRSFYTLLFLFSYVTNAQLNELAKRSGLLYFGTATDNPANDAAYSAALSNTLDFGQVTSANQQKWDATEGAAEGVFKFTSGDAIASLAASNNQILRCHALVWHQQLPTWVTSGVWTKESLTRALQAHVTGEVFHYKGQCYAWDVVNEALNDNGTFRNDVFFNVIGPDYIKIAFEAAAIADPGAKLYYNDFSIEAPGRKTTAAQNIVKTLQAAGTKIDGVGFQSHFIVGSTPSRTTQISNLESFTALGVEVALTELDIRMKLPSTTAQLAQQSQDYQDSVAACVAVTGCVGVTVWDFDDKYSWVPSTFPGFGAADLFDEAVAKKPAYFGAVAALSGSNSTTTGARFREVNSTIGSAATGTRFIAPTGTGLSPPSFATGVFTGSGDVVHNPLTGSYVGCLSLLFLYKFLS